VTVWEIMLKYHENYGTLERACKIPKKGYKSITVRDEIYERFKQEWSKNKSTYVKKGISSLAGFIAYLLEEEIAKRLPPVQASINLPRFEHFNMGDNGVKIIERDGSGKIMIVADVYFKPQGIFCDFDKLSTCVHIKFALTVTEIQEQIRKLRREGWVKLPDV